MKKLLLLSVLFAATSCSKTATEEKVLTADCNCDRIVALSTFNILGTPQNPAITYHTVYTTINDCSQIQKQKTHNTTFTSAIPKIGECR